MRFHLRGFTSLLLAITFVTIGFSGIMLYVSPKGRVAHWTGWTMLGLEKEEWSALHINFGLLFLIAAGLHWFLNWDLFWSYLKAKNARRLNLVAETTAAVVISALFLLGTMFLIPPLETVVWANGWMQNYWEERSPRPPAPHAQEFKLRRFAFTIGLTTDELKEALRKEGYTVQSDFVTVGELASQHGKVPSDILAAVQRHFPTAGSRSPGCQGQGMGGGQGMGRGQGMGQGMGRGTGRGQGMGQGMGKSRSGGQDRGSDQGENKSDDSAEEPNPVAPSETELPDTTPPTRRRASGLNSEV